MQKQNFFTDNPDILFHLEHRLDFDALLSILTPAEKSALGVSTADEYRTVVRSVLETLGEVSGTLLAGNAAKVEKEPIKLTQGEVQLPPSLVENLNALLQLGCASIGASPQYGGMGIPFIFEMMANEVMMRACPSTGLNIVWFAGIGHIIEKFASQAIKDQVMPRITAGEWSGCMALTEPDAGSDLANLRTYAESQPDGSVRLYGSKRFITNGAGQIGLVLAMREKGATGLGNINLYMCLRKNQDGSDNYKVTKIEEKLALHGSATCELNFDGSHAVLLGEDKKGFQHMLHLMNDARIAVGFQGLGVIESVWRLAKAYAEDRRTWGKPIAQHEMIAEKLLDMEMELKAIRSICYQAAYSMSLLTGFERQLAGSELGEAERQKLDSEAAKLRRRIRRYTPLIKWYVGEKTPVLARDGLNIHGGYGFTTEYRAEWWLRESIILALYEGTSQIQALMCVKDTMKSVIRRPASLIETALGIKLQKLRTRDPIKRLLYEAKQIESSAVISLLVRLFKVNAQATMSEVKDSDLLRMVKHLASDLMKMQNISPAMLHAERLTEIKALVALGECLYRDGELDSSRRWVAERFLTRALPRMQMLKAQIEAKDPWLDARLSPPASAPAAHANAAQHA